MSKTNIYIRIVSKRNGVPVKGLVKVGVLKVREDRLPVIDLDSNYLMEE